MTKNPAGLSANIEASSNNLSPNEIIKIKQEFCPNANEVNDKKTQ